MTINHLKSIFVAITLTTPSCTGHFDDFQNPRLAAITEDANIDLRNREITCDQKAELTRRFLERINRIYETTIIDFKENYINSIEANMDITETSTATRQLLELYKKQCENSLEEPNPTRRYLTSECQLPRLTNINQLNELESIEADLIFSQNILDSETGFCALRNRSKQVVIHTLQTHRDNFTENQLQRAELLGLL